MKGNNSTEDYLKCILSLQNEKGSVRAVDIARAIKVTKPTVSVTVRKLYDQDLICFDQDGHIYLTIKGKETAEKVNEKNILIKKALRCLGVSESTASEEACLMEHVIGEETYRCLERFFERHGQTE
ncbi:MAG: metal-dependent transcriptional regulator [Lachnospiraceae bacterium]|nr:metal-dependent transcriptional regulator [Lachnospiraceae bacterium]